MPLAALTSTGMSMAPSRNDGLFSATDSSESHGLTPYSLRSVEVLSTTKRCSGMPGS